MSRTSALKVLDHSMTGPEGADNCQKFVDILGLGRIFPLFIKTPKAHKKAGPNKRELEGNYCAVLHCLVFEKSCSPAVFQITLFWSPYKVFLQFLYL